MARYIDADKVKEMLCGDCAAKDKINCGYCKAGFNIDDVPTADVVTVVHGKTIVKEFSIPKCSICGGTVCCNEYCCHCGAKLDEAKNNVC